MAITGKKIRVMIVDDSILFRSFLISALEKDDRFEVAGYAIDAFDAMKKIPLLHPDVLTLDIEMPKMSGLEFLKELMPKYRLPVILVSSLNIRVFDALAAGAVDYVHKPDMSDENNKSSFSQNLLSKIMTASVAKVRTSQSQPSTSASHELAWKQAARKSEGHFPGENMVIAIGASTGGTEAILSVVRNFPKNMPGVVITQHMPPGFTAMYAERLNRICNMEVREAKHGDHIRQGLMLIAPGGFQMRVVRMGSGFTVSCTEEEKVSGHCPSVDVLFTSVASSVREKAIGIILTGMGSDGAAGLLRMKKNGAFTIGQDKESCVVYGMPMEAFKIGAVCQQASLLNIPSLVYKKLGIH